MIVTTAELLYTFSITVPLQTSSYSQIVKNVEINLKLITEKNFLKL